MATSISFPFNLDKAVSVMCNLLGRSKVPVDINRLVTMLYLIDRHAIARRNFPVIGGSYYSTESGPVIGEAYEIVLSEAAFGQDGLLNRWIARDLVGWCVKLQSEYLPGSLGGDDIHIVDVVYKGWSDLTAHGLRVWCKEHCAEGMPYQEPFVKIDLEKLFMVLGKTPDDFGAVRERLVHGILAGSTLAQMTKISS